MQNPLYVPILEVPEGSRVEIGNDRQKYKKEGEDRKVASLTWKFRRKDDNYDNATLTCDLLFQSEFKMILS